MTYINKPQMKQMEGLAVEPLGVLSQDKFAYDANNVVDTVIMGHTRSWEILQEQDCTYSLPAMSEENGVRMEELGSDPRVLLHRAEL